MLPKVMIRLTFSCEELSSGLMEEGVAGNLRLVCFFKWVGSGLGIALCLLTKGMFKYIIIYNNIQGVPFKKFRTKP